MQKYHVAMRDELGKEFSVIVEMPDLVENVTEYVREEYPESTILFIRQLAW